MDSDKKNLRLQIGIALFATLVPVVTTIIFNLSQEKTKQVSVYASNPVKLIKTENKEFEKISVFYDSIFVDNIIIRHIIIENTGEYSIVKEDFYDSPIRFEFRNKDKNSQTKLPNILDVIMVNNANQQNSILEIGKDHNSFFYKPSLLNPGEKVQIDILNPDLPNLELVCIGKLKDGKSINLLTYNDLSQESKFSSFIKSIQNLFKIKWISIALSIVCSILILLAGIGFISNSYRKESDDYNLNFLGWFIGVTTITFGFLLIGLTIAIIVI